MGQVIEFPRESHPLEGVPAGRPAPDPLWREMVGDVLRTERKQAGRTLADVAEQAGISTPYLSEVERGRKEPSSEVLSAVAGALGLRLVDLTVRVSRELARTAPRGPVCLAA
jgi:predicted transcriptional regulator